MYKRNVVEYSLVDSRRFITLPTQLTSKSSYGLGNKIMTGLRSMNIASGARS